MKSAVFSDVDGTLIGVSVPRVSIQIAREMGLISRGKLAKIGVLRMLLAVLPQSFEKNLALRMIGTAIEGQPLEVIGKVNQQALAQLQQHFKPKTLAQLHAHQKLGIPLVLLSGGMHEAIESLAAPLNARGEGTRFVIRDGIYTATLSGIANVGAGKAARARLIAAECGYDLSQSWAYGDGVSDIPFLSLFGHPTAVDPDPGLRAEAQKRGWPILMN